MVNEVTLVLQGRIKSSRLPCKGYLTFFNKTIWERMCDIAHAIDIPKKIVFATGDDAANTISKPVFERSKIDFFVGSESNVLKRFCDVAKKYPSKYIIRLTCDNYLLQPELVEDLYELVLRGDADYGFIRPLSHYCGEIIRSETLIEQINQESNSLSQEHVTWGIRNSNKYKVTSLGENYKNINHSTSVTLDTVDDFIKMKTLEVAMPNLEKIKCLNEIKKIT